MINVSRIVTSRNFAKRGGFTVYRQSGQWVRGRWKAEPETPLQLQGSAIPASSEDLEQVPEGDRVKGVMCFYSPQPMYITREEGTSDEIVWQEERYRIASAKPWNEFGYYKALGVRMVSD